MESITTLEIPLYVPKYKANTSYGYEGKKGERLLEVLYDASDGYCMYCYTKIEVDSKRFGQLEHFIEKKHTKKSGKLKECVPNIAIACPKCNLSFKKKGDKIRIFTKDQKQVYEASTCIGEKCTKECAAYKEMKKVYISKRKIILPLEESGEDVTTYKIQYNLLKLEFEPSTKVAYTQAQKEIIMRHIEKFNLNDAQYRTKEILKCCEDIINGDRSLRKKKYNNYVVDLFMDKLKILDDEQKQKLCTRIYILGKMKKII